MLNGANSLDNDLVKLMPAALVTDVGRLAALGALPPPIAALIIEPDFFSFMIGKTSLHNLTAAINFKLISSSQF